MAVKAVAVISEMHSDFPNGIRFSVWMGDGITQSLSTQGPFIVNQLGLTMMAQLRAGLAAELASATFNNPLGPLDTIRIIGGQLLDL